MEAVYENVFTGKIFMIKLLNEKKSDHKTILQYDSTLVKMKKYMED